MTLRLKRALLTVVSGSALAIAPVAFATILVPATSHADDKTLNCPDGTIVDSENKQCVDLVQGISKQLQALPAPPSLSGFGGGGLGSTGGLGGFPSLGTINAPDLVLPSVGLGLVPNLNVNLQPQIGGFNPSNPLGLGLPSL